MKIQPCHPRRSATRRAFLSSTVCTGISFGLASWMGAEEGPNSSLYSGRLAQIQQLAPPGPRGSFATAAGAAAPMSWYEVPPPPAKEVKIHDIVTIRVDTGARVSESAQLQRRRTAQYDAKLSDWIVLEGLRAIRPAPQSEGDQQIR